MNAISFVAAVFTYSLMAYRIIIRIPFYPFLLLILSLCHILLLLISVSVQRTCTRICELSHPHSAVNCIHCSRSQRGGPKETERLDVRRVISGTEIAFFRIVEIVGVVFWPFLANENGLKWIKNFQSIRIRFKSIKMDCISYKYFYICKSLNKLK